MGVETGNDALDDRPTSACKNADGRMVNAKELLSPSACLTEAHDEDEDALSSSTYTMTLTAFDGTRYEYDAPLFDRVAIVATALGGLLTGLLSVGIGESVVPQLTRRRVALTTSARRRGLAPLAGSWPSTTRSS